MSENNFIILLNKRQVNVPGLGRIFYSLVDFPVPDNPGETVMRMDYSLRTESGETLSDSLMVKAGDEVEIVYDRAFWIGTVEK